jgi:hypothetical protein
MMSTGFPFFFVNPFFFFAYLELTGGPASNFDDGQRAKGGLRSPDREERQGKAISWYTRNAPTVSFIHRY